ncbi:hypothetical protein ACEWY4_020829 [Coilia grayii]|uniref:Uncharacterized protein n=1 Tax=Coilia grayii TaxID=363190 RepID=A0ABD1J8L8_9TELE
MAEQWWNGPVREDSYGQQPQDGRGRVGYSGQQPRNGRAGMESHVQQRWNDRADMEGHVQQPWNGRGRRGNFCQQPWNGRGRKGNFCQQPWNGRADMESGVQHRMNDRRSMESYVQGVHMSIDQLKTKDLHCKNYIARNVAEPSEIPYGFSVPHYPRPVEFRTFRVAHVTTEYGLHGIMNCSGFKGGERSGRLWFGLVIGQKEIDAAEQRYLEKLFPARTPWEKRRQMPFLHNFTTSPVFNVESRYGNFRFSFSLPDVLQAYSAQFCGGKEPILRVWETIVYKQEVMYTVLVHSPDVYDYDGFPILGYNDKGVCAYWNGEITWRAQAVSQTHKCRLIENRNERELDVEEGWQNPYVWDHVTLAFDIPADSALLFPYNQLLRSLTACGDADTALNPLIGRAAAEEIIWHYNNRNSYNHSRLFPGPAWGVDPNYFYN